MQLSHEQRARGPKDLRPDGALAQNRMGGRGSEQLSPQTPQTPNMSLYLETREGNRGNPEVGGLPGEETGGGPPAPLPSQGTDAFLSHLQGGFFSKGNHSLFRNFGKFSKRGAQKYN